jgi:preprotein translocase subunit Sec61beta
MLRRPSSGAAQRLTPRWVVAAALVISVIAAAGLVARGLGVSA